MPYSIHRDEYRWHRGKQLKVKLDKTTKQEIIAPVTMPTACMVNSLVVVPKKNGKLRLRMRMSGSQGP